MAGVEVSVPSLDQIKAMLAPYIDAALSVVDDGTAAQLIKDKAILDNEDVNGEQMPPKVPKPKNNPQNFPNMPLIQNTEPDLMNHDRFSSKRIDDTTAAVIFDPPDHNDYLLDKPQEVGGGGRHWIGRDGTVNPNARAEIEAEMARRVKL